MAKIALVNNLSSHCGLGKYAFSLYHQLKKITDIDHIFFDYEEGSLKCLNKNKIITKITSLKLFKNKLLTIKWLGKYIPKYSLYHIANQNLSFLNIKPKIVSCHDVIGCKFPSNLIEFNIRKYLYSGLKNSEKIIVDSACTKKDLINLLGIPRQKIKIVYLGVDHAIFKQTIDPKKSEKITILHASSGEKRKNVENLARALSKVRTKMKFHFVIIGDPVNFHLQFHKILESHKVDYYIKKGLTEEALSHQYNISDLFVFPSLYEGFGLPVLEAMACGCPVITSNLSSLPEVGGDAPLYVNPHDVNGIARAIERVLTNKNLRKEMIEKGLKQAKKFSWEKTAKETVEAYREVLGK